MHSHGGLHGGLHGELHGGSHAQHDDVELSDSQGQVDSDGDVADDFIEVEQCPYPRDSRDHFRERRTRGSCSRGAGMRSSRRARRAGEVIDLTADSDGSDGAADAANNRARGATTTATATAAAAAGWGSEWGTAPPEWASEDVSVDVECAACHVLIPIDRSLDLPRCSCLLCLSCARASFRPQMLELKAQLVSEQNTARHVADKGEKAGTGLSERRESPARSSDSRDSMACPCCGQPVPALHVQALLPEEFRQWEEAATSAALAAFSRADEFVRCPGCDVLVEKLPAEPPPGAILSGVPEIDRTAPMAERDEEGRVLSREAIVHKAGNRFRCGECAVVFCGSCRAHPYHLGLSCAAYAARLAAPKCLYCGERVEGGMGDGREGDGAGWGSSSGGGGGGGGEGDTGWCVEKSDLAAVAALAARVCGEEQCREKLKAACTRTSPCGHPCGGVRGEVQCLPCLQDPCLEKLHTAAAAAASASASATAAAAAAAGGHGVGSSQAAGKGKSLLRSSAAPPPQASPPLPCASDFCPICWVEPICAAPAIRLASCGHVVHVVCAREKIRRSFPGPDISFGFLACPLCPSTTMAHPALQGELAASLVLKKQVEELAVERMRAEGLVGGGGAANGADVDGWDGGERDRERRGVRGRHDGYVHGNMEGYGNAGGRGLRSGKGSENGRERSGSGSSAGGDVLAVALRRFLFFLCSRCQLPYFGGDRRCGAGPAAAEPDDQAGHGDPGMVQAGGAREGGGEERAGGRGGAVKPKSNELVCGDCLASEALAKQRAAAAAAAVAAEEQRGKERGMDKGKGKAVGVSGVGGKDQLWEAGECTGNHGRGFIQFKCRFCCSTASYFCFGTTHFCAECHESRPDSSRSNYVVPQCTGGDICPLRLVWHPRAPDEFCLGCALCRLQGQKMAHGQRGGQG
ncbi:unnamed protein product [Closterium sp. NIES-65]|nr:unnamed protein product [Closterium sp. NIES-65]